MLQRTLNPRRLSNAAFGVAEIVDGIVRILTVGHVHTRLPIEQARWAMQQHINRLKRGRV